MGFGANYTANPLAVQPPSAPPGPGVLPTVYLPADQDGATWANLAQGTKTNTDFIGHIQTAVRLDTAVASLGNGFSAITHTGSGSGTVVPGSTAIIAGGQANSAAGLRVLIKIVTPGIGGVATYQTSLDGGNTWGAVQTTGGATSVLDATSGIVQQMAGTFVAGDTYAFRSAFTPLASWKDAAGRNRSLISHNGFAGGQVIQDATLWNNNVNDGGKWQNFQNGTGNTAAVATASVQFGLGASWHGRYLNLAVPATPSTNWVNAQTVYPVADFGDTSLVFELEWMAGTFFGSGGITSIMGLGFGTTTVAPTAWGYRGWFKAGPGDANWQLQYQYNGGTLNTVDSGIPYMAGGAASRFKIEWHGSATPTGIAFGSGVVLYFIDGKLAGARAVSAGTQPLNIVMDAETGGNSQGIFIGPVRWRHNLVDVDAVL
jgi:hypothetical protein